MHESSREGEEGVETKQQEGKLVVGLGLCATGTPCQGLGAHLRYTSEEGPEQSVRGHEIRECYYVTLGPSQRSSFFPMILWKLCGCFFS